MVGKVLLLPEKDVSTLKKAIAQILYEKHIDQSRISKIVGLSQPMVSNYCKSKDIIPLDILKKAQSITQRIQHEDTVHFQTCVSFSDSYFDGYYYIADKNEILTDEKRTIVNNLSQAFSILKEKNLQGLIPEVKINMAMSKKNPASSDDIASFLNGLIIVENKITGYNGIRFGKSRHLSSLLLKYGKDLQFHAIMNIAYHENIKKTHFEIGVLKKDFELDDAKKGIDILLHPGDFGIEPCVYVLGKDAKHVANKILEIKEKIR